MAAVVAVLVAATSFIRLPYDTLSPGASPDVGESVSIEGHPSYPAKGRVLSTTVAVRISVNPYQVLGAWVDPHTDVVRREVLRGGVPESIYQELNREAMVDSKTTAKVVALRRLGFTDLTGGAEITGVEPGFPAAAVLKPGDVIVAVGGQRVRNNSDAVEAIGRRKPGDVLTLNLERDGSAAREVRAELGAGPEGQARLGVLLATKVVLPFEIDIDSGSVSGPSAGLAYGLELLDLLTPGELTGGTTVAATGDLQPDGQVGAVGGVRQKTLGARKAGATVFLVPRANEAEARAAAGPDLRIVAVENFDHAVNGLGTLAGSNALALEAPRATTDPPS